MNLLVDPVLPLLLSLALAGGATPCDSPTTSLQLGDVPIGAAPTDFSPFRSTDCEGREPPLHDCSAEGKDGLTYAFFDGALSRVVADAETADADVLLPGGIEFGEDIDRVDAKLRRAGLAPDRGTDGAGNVVLSTDFVVRSAAGVDYSLELRADAGDRLVEVVARTDF